MFDQSCAEFFAKYKRLYSRIEYDLYGAAIHPEGWYIVNKQPKQFSFFYGPYKYEASARLVRAHVHETTNQYCTIVQGSILIDVVTSHNFKSSRSARFISFDSKT